MNIDTLISMMLAPILIKLAEQLIGWITEQLQNIADWVKKLRPIATVSISGRQRPEYNDSRNVILISKMSEKLIKLGCDMRITELQYIRGAYKKVASNTVVYDGMTFIFSKSISNDKDDKYVEFSLIIKHTDATKIHQFIDDCTRQMDRKNDYSYKQYYYGQTKNKDGNTVHRALKFVPTTTFDDVFFEGKDKLVQAIDGHIAGVVPKIALYMHGEPGCGKTSICKAIAAKTGYSVMEIKLSMVKHDDELRNLVFDNAMYVYDQGSHYHRAVDTKRRIYLFEDIDAETDVVFARSDGKSGAEKQIELEDELDKVDPPKSGKTSTTKKSILEDMIKMQKLTLQGMLNVLDGIIALDGIVIITTNHPEKLDPALIRPGRMTHRIKMGRLSAECGGQLVRKFHPEWTGTIPADKYTPAELEVICQTHTSAELAEIIG